MMTSLLVTTCPDQLSGCGASGLPGQRAPGPAMAVSTPEIASAQTCTTTPSLAKVGLLTTKIRVWEQFIILSNFMLFIKKMKILSRFTLRLGLFDTMKFTDSSTFPRNALTSEAAFCIACDS